MREGKSDARRPAVKAASGGKFDRAAPIRDQRRGGDKNAETESSSGEEADSGEEVEERGNFGDNYDDEDEEEEDEEEGEDEEDSDEGDDEDAGSDDNSSGSGSDYCSADEVLKKPEAKKDAGPAKLQFNKNVPLFKILAKQKAEEARLQQQLDQEPHDRGNRKRLKRSKSASEFDSDDSSDGKKKRNKHAPVEMRSDRPVRTLRVDADNSVKKSIDPRFADFSGQLDQRIFAKNYGFLEDYRKDEIAALAKTLKKAKNSQKQEEIKMELLKLKSQLKQRQHAVRVMNKIDEIKQSEREKVKAGVKKPFFMKNSAKKQLALDEQFKELKKDGKLKKYMERKNKKQASKGRRWMPTRRDETA